MNTRLLLPLFALATTLHAADWPQYRGLTGDGRTTEKILKPWPATGPKVLWKAPTSAGFTGVLQ